MSDQNLNNPDPAALPPNPAPKPEGAITPDKPAAGPMPEGAVTATKPAAPAKPTAPAKAGPTRRNAVLGFFTSSLAIAWTSFAASMGALTLGTVRFLVPNVLAEPPTSSRSASPTATRKARSSSASRTRTPGSSQGTIGDHLRPEHHLHAPRLHAQLARTRAEIQVPLPRLRLLHQRHQLRRPGPATAGTLGRRHRRRRPDCR